MSLQTQITGTPLTNIRSYRFGSQQFIAVVPNDTVVQFLPSVAPTDSTYAEITVGTIQSGNMSNVREGMTVIYSETTDFKSTELFRNYVRKVSGTSTLYIGQASQNLTTSIYVTVVNTYEFFEKPASTRNGVNYANWDLGFRRLLAVEQDLPTAVVLDKGVTSYSPTANPQEMDNDATSTFTHAWESSNSNDTLDSGGTTNNPTFTLEADSHRWIRYTFTDSNGNANFRVISVWTVPDNLNATFVYLGFIGRNNEVAGIQRTIDSITATLPAMRGVELSNLMQGTFCAVFSDVYVNNSHGATVSNIDCVGWLGYETINTAGDPRHGVMKSVQFVLDTIPSKLQVTPILPLQPVNDASPTNWDEIENPDPMRVITYLLTEYTTVAHLCSIKILSNHTDYTAPSDYLRSESEVVMDAIRYQAEGMNAYIQFGADGIIDISQNLVELDDTARNGAETIVEMTPSDWLEYQIERDPNPKVRFLMVHAGVYNTSADTYDVYRMFVPPYPTSRQGTFEERNNMVLTANSDDATAQAEAIQRGANLFAALNPTDIIRMTLKDSWYFLQPDVSVWYKFTVALEDTLRGIVYSTSDRWQLIEISHSSNNKTGRKQVNAVFRRETQDTQANIEVTKVQQNVDNNVNPLPGALPPYVGGNLDMTGGLNLDALDPTPPSYPPPPSADCENIGWRAKDSAGATTDRSALLGENITYAVSGYGALVTGYNETFDFTTTNGGFLAVVAGEYDFDPNLMTSGSGGSYSSGTGWTHGDWINGAGTHVRGIHIMLDLGSVQAINDVSVTLDFTKGTFTNPNANAWRVAWSTANSINGADSSFAGHIFADAKDISTGNDQTVTYSGSFQARWINLRFTSCSTPSGFTGAVTIKDLELNGASIFGDALYYWSEDSDPVAYDSGEGLLYMGSQPASIPSYNSNHVYALEDGGASSGVRLFEFNSPYNQNAMDNWSIQATVCFNGVP